MPSPVVPPHTYTLTGPRASSAKNQVKVIPFGVSGGGVGGGDDDDDETSSTSNDAAEILKMGIIACDGDNYGCFHLLLGADVVVIVTHPPFHNDVFRLGDCT